MPTDATVSVTRNRRPFIWLHDVSLAAGTETTWRLYTAAADEKLLMAKLFFKQVGAVAFNIQFYVGNNALTSACSILIPKANLQLTTDVYSGFYDSEPHMKLLLGAAADIDFMMSRSGTGTNNLLMDIALFYEET